MTRGAQAWARIAEHLRSCGNDQGGFMGTDYGSDDGGLFVDDDSFV